jgi:hypothetical protein
MQLSQQRTPRDHRAHLRDDTPEEINARIDARRTRSTASSSAATS